MMGEYLLYIDNLLIGGIYDGRLLIKKTSSNEEFHLKEGLPFKIISDVWDKLDNNIGNIIKELNQFLGFKDYNLPLKKVDDVLHKKPNFKQILKINLKFKDKEKVVSIIERLNKKEGVLAIL